MSTFSCRVSFLIALVILGGAFAPAAPEPADRALPAPLAINIPLAKEQLKLIDQVVADMDFLLRNGELGATEPGFNVWSRRRVDALRASGAGKAEMVLALEQHLDRMKKLEATVKVLSERGEANRRGVLAAQYERLEAQMWLNQEKAR